MFRLFRYTAFSALVLAATLTARAQSFDKEWLKIDSLIQQKNQIEALDVTQNIYDRAIASGNSHEILRAAIMLNRLNAPSSDNANYNAKSYLFFDSVRIRLNQDGLKAVCHYLQAVCLNSYAKALYYSIPVGNILGLEQDNLKDTLYYHFEQAFLLAGREKTKDYADFIPGCTKEYISLHPALKDVLLENSCIKLGSLGWNNRTGLTGTARQFLEDTRSIDKDNPTQWQLYVLRLLTERNLKANADIRASIDCKRIRTVLENAPLTDWIGVSAQIEQLADSYSKKSRHSAGLYMLAAKALTDHVIKDNSIDKETRSSFSVHAYSLLNKAQDIWPDSEIAHECRTMTANLEKRTVTISFDRTGRADMPNLGILTFSNIDTVYFRALKYDPTQHHFNSYQLNSQNSLDYYHIPEQFERMDEVATWSIETSRHDDRIEHSMWMSIPALPKGEYVIIASPYKNTVWNCVSCRLFTSSRIVFTPTYLSKTYDDCRLTGFISDAATGDALSGCSLLLTNVIDEDLDTLISINGRTGTDGFLDMTFPRDADNNLMLIVNSGTEPDTLIFESRHHEYNNDYTHPIHIRMNTDRAIYRPGDTIQYCGIVSETPSDMNGHVVSNAPVTVFVSMGHGRDEICIQTINSDSHGRFTGQWPIPADFRPGWISLETVIMPQGAELEKMVEDYDDIRRLPGYSSTSITIESYVRPLMELTFDKMQNPPLPGTQAECSGKIMTPLGNPVVGATIRWNATVSRKNSHTLSWRYYKETVIDAGETVTGPDGSFTIHFKADADTTESITLNATVTDGNGETHEYDTDIYMYRHTFIYSEPYTIIESPQDTVFVVDTEAYYPTTGTFRIKIEALNPVGKKGIDIYKSFNVKESDRKEMSDHALSQDSLNTLFPDYDFTIQAEPQVSYALMDSTIVFNTNEKTYISIPEIKTGLYRFTISSSDAEIRSLDNIYNYDSNKKSLTKDIFISVGNGQDALLTDELLWAQGRRIILNDDDTATVRIGSPYPGTVIRYDVINRNGSLCHGTMIADGNLHNLSFPVTEDLYGNILVVATAYKDGRKAKSFVAQYIPYHSKQLKFELSSFRSNLTSGVQESWTFRFKDRQGKPVRASVLIDMYDSVLDQFRQNRWEFYPWLYMDFITRERILFNDVFGNISSTIPVTEYKGIRATGLGIADPLSSPIINGLPIPLREIGSSSVSSSYLPTLNNSATLIPQTTGSQNYSGPTEIRTKLSHTGLFLTDLQTDQDGFVTVSFKAPELLTRWKMQLIAYTDDLLTAGIQGYVTTSRPLMVEPAAPRFFRQGDVMEFVQKVTNSDSIDLDVTVTARFADADSGTSLDLTGGDSVRYVTVKAGTSSNVAFTLTIPDGIKAITYTVIAAAQGFSDGQRETIPVLSNRIQVTKSLSLFNNGNETRTFRSDAPQTSASGTVFDESLTLQYHSSPIWYAVDALPTLTESDTPDNISQLFNFAGQAMTYMTAYLFPAVMKRLSSSFPDEMIMTESFESSLQKISDRRNSDGGWPWMPGGQSSAYITSLILYVYDFLELTSEFEYNTGLRFLANAAKERNSDLSHLDVMFIYLYSKQGKSKIYDPDTDKLIDALLDSALKRNHNDKDLYYRGLLIQALMNYDKADFARNLAQKLIEESKYSDEMGRWWEENRGGYLWNEAPIETQAVLIRALKAAGFETEANEAARWLLKQKETTAWESSVATAMAVMALIETSSGSLPDPDSGITVTIGNDRIDSGADADDSGYMSRTWNGPVTPDKSLITVTSNSDGISWGALYHTFTQNLDNVDGSGNGMQLKRTLWRVIRDAQGERLEEVTPATILHKGDRIKVKLELTLDRTYEYLQLRSERPASFEPVSTKAGYTYNAAHDILYYGAPTNTSDDLYIERLQSGNYLIEYNLYVQRSGSFRTGTATVQCLYAPAYRAITPSTTLTVE